MNLPHLLRSATAGLHRELDSSIRIDRATTSLDGYADYLEQFHRGLSSSLREIDWNAATCQGLPDGTRRSERYASLARDLRALGRPVRDVSPGIDGPAPAWGRSVGCLYVLEGSVHGGRHILEKLESRTGPLRAEVSRFVRGFGDDTPALWQDFMGWLASLPADDSLTSSAISSAIETFERFITSFSRDPRLVPSFHP